MMRIAVQRDGSDRFPIMFRDDCERTECDSYGNSETLFQVIQEMDAKGYDLVSYEEARERKIRT